MNIATAFAQWQELAAGIDKNDGPALAESWNDYTDSLCEDGELSALQYHYCPAWDDTMPDDDSDREFILDAMGLAMKTTRVDARPDSEGSDWEVSASHWRVMLRRYGKRMTVFYSMGSAHTGSPDLDAVLDALLRDAESADESFSDWCDNFGMDTDSRKAEQMHKACKRTAASLARLFSSSELTDLRELFEGY